MGAYLSEPIVDKVSCDESSDKQRLSYGASGMQGWRVSQEDAHNCILEFDDDTSLFAVYDGHGGHEVAAYCAEHLPEFLKHVESYKQGDFAKALEEAYLGFDQHLTKEDVVKMLHCIAGNKTKEAPSDDDPDEMSDLYEEATMSIEELITRYGKRIRDGAVEELKEGRSVKPALDFVVSKLCAKQARKMAAEESSAAAKAKEEAKTEEKTSETSESDPSPAKEPTSTEPEEPNKEGDKEEKVSSPTKAASPESNGKHQNGSEKSGSDNHEAEKPKSTENDSTPVVVVSSKGKGVGKGLSNNIRKPVERTPEEQERDRREAERIAKRLERKKSLRKKSGDELYRAMVTNEEEEESDEDGEDDEEDEDFEGDTSSSSDEAGADEEDENEWEDEEDEEVEEEEDNEEVAAKARSFSMNLKEEPGSDSGCTAVVALLRGNTLYVANAGDSRCVLSRQGRAIPLSADHKPEDEPEKSRIERAGGVVTADGRVNGGLNLSRAIGDHAYKQNTELGPREQMITALPDIQSIELQEGDDFFVLACDGIWNSKSNQQVVDFIRPRLSQSKTLSKICEELFDECLAPNTMGDGTGCDNMTAIIVRLDRFLPQTSETPSHPLKRPLPVDNPTEGEFPPNSEATNGSCEKVKRQRLDEEGMKQEEACAKEADAVTS